MTTRLPRTLIVLIALAAAVPAAAVTLYRNPAALPTYEKQSSPWTANHCLVVDTGGGTATFKACPTSGTVTGLTADAGGTTTGATVTLAGGTNGIDTSRSSDTVTFNLDLTEIGTGTFGAGSGIVWTFDASAGTDTAITFGNGTVNVSTGTLQQGGTAVVLQSRTISTGTGLTGGGDLSANRSLTFEYGFTLAGNPAFSAGECAFDSSERGLICEGATSNSAEALLAFPDPGADITITLPNATDTLVGRDTTDTLTNKTLTTPTIASFTNATHSHQNAVGGGTLDAAAIAAGTLAVARGGTNLTASSDDNVMVGNGTTWQSKAVPDCDDSGGNHLNYDTGTNAFSCGTSGGGSGAPSTAEYIVATLDGGLSAERVLTAGTAIDVTFTSGVATVDWVSTEINDRAFGDNSDATIQWTWQSSGATDPVIQFSNNAVNVSTGALQVGGTAVVLASRTLTGGAGIGAIGDLSADRTIATASGEADFLASGALTCGASTQGKAQVHTTPLQYCDNAGTPTLRYAAYGNSSGEATAAANDSVALTTDTTGNYVSSATANQGLLLTGTEGASLGLIDCAAGQVLHRNAGDTAWECATIITAGSGAEDTLTRWDAGGILTDSAWLVDDDGFTVSGAASSATSGTKTVMHAAVNFAPSSGSATTTIEGVRGEAIHANANSQTGGAMIGVSGVAEKGTTGAVNTAVGVRAQVKNSHATNAITNGYGLQILAPVTTGAITNLWGIHQAGTEPNYLAGRLGIGTDVVPHGGIGMAKLALEGADSSTSGPHIQLTTATDDRPLLLISGWSHDNIGLCWDCYWNGSNWVSSDAGSNILTYKWSDRWSIYADFGTSAGSTNTFDLLFSIGSGETVFNEDGVNQDTRFEGDTLTNVLIVDAGLDQVIVGRNGVELVESDTNPPCSSGNFTIYADLSENKLKKCQNGTVSDLGASSAGDVVGPGSATDNALARYDGTTGKLLQDSVWTLDDTGQLGGAFTTTSTSVSIGLGAAVTGNAGSGTPAYVGANLTATTSSGAASGSTVEGAVGSGTCATSNGCTTIAGFQGSATKSGTGAVTDAYGVFASVANTNATGAITNAYGVYIANSTTTGAITNDFALYTAGAEASSFGGNVDLRAGILTGAITSTTTNTVVGVSHTVTGNASSSTPDYAGASFTATTASGTVSVDDLEGVFAHGVCATSSGCDVVRGARAIGSKSGTGAVATAYGLYARVENSGASGTLTNGYGVYIEDSLATSAITNDFGLYQAGGESNYFAGKVGFGTTTIPHGGVGSAWLAIEGANANATTGPHMQWTTASDDYPLRSFLNWSHDNIADSLDAFWNGSAWTSSDAGSNFQVYKLSDRLEHRFNFGTAANSAITWKQGLTFTSSGLVVNEDSEDWDVRVEGNGDANLIFADAGTDRLGIGTAVPTAKVHVRQATLGGGTICLQSDATNDDPTRCFYDGRSGSTDGSTFTLWSTTLLSGKSYLIGARVVARRTGGASGTANDSAVYILEVGANHNGTNARAIANGSTSLLYSAEDQTGWGCAFDFNSNDVRLRCNGAASNDVTWHAQVSFQEMST